MVLFQQVMCIHKLTELDSDPVVKIPDLDQQHFCHFAF
jgi:hypothetical protein